MNLIVYLTPDWDSAWYALRISRAFYLALPPSSHRAFGRGGGLQLWEADMARLGKVVPCTFNMGVMLLLPLLLPLPLLLLPAPPSQRPQVLFRTTDQSWHGLPDPIASPPGTTRNR